MALEVFILGSGGSLALPDRGLTSVLVRREGELHLFDCGESLQLVVSTIFRTFAEAVPIGFLRPFTAYACSSASSIAVPPVSRAMFMYFLVPHFLPAT